jgi:hypothetical protein
MKNGGQWTEKRERERERERDIKMPTMTMPKSIKTQRHVVSLLPFAIMYSQGNKFLEKNF